MTYSACDFHDDVMRCLVSVGAVDSDYVERDCGSVGNDADLAIAGITGMKQPAAAAAFLDELFDSIETLGALVEQYGASALISLIYLITAIARGSHIEVLEDERGILAIVRGLPSAADWLRYVQIIV